MQRNSSYIDQSRDQPSPIQEADELMNSLFSEMEQTLSITSTTNIIRYEDDEDRQFSYSLAAIAKADPNLPSKAVKGISKLVKVKQKVNLRNLPEFGSQPEHDIDLEFDSPKIKESLGIDSFLIGSALTSAVFAVVLGFVNANLSTPSSRLQVAQVNDLSAPLAEKLRRSLAEIQTTPQESPQSLQTSIGGTLSKQNPNIVSVIDTPQKPIYIPIYQPPTALAAPTPSIPPVNPAPAIPTPNVTAPLPPKKSIPTGNYTLIGVLDLGDRSSAMIDINGSIQSIKIGNVVGDSGWKVSRIAQQEVILKRGSEDTKVTVGQKF